MAVRPEDLAEALMSRRRRTAAEYDRRAAGLRRTLEAAMLEAARDESVTRAWLIGSLARGDFGAGSDIDVVVEGLAAENFAALWDELGERLGVEVDLLRLEELSPSFRARVLREGIPLVG